MPTRKIADVDQHRSCMNPVHNPPSHRVFEPGVYEHECPGCGKKQVLRIDKQWCDYGSPSPRREW